MTDFAFYFETGWHHIISSNASDHILFIIALTSIYLISNWKQVLVLITSYILINRLGFYKKWWISTLSVIAILFALGMIKERWPF